MKTIPLYTTLKNYNKILKRQHGSIHLKEQCLKRQSAEVSCSKRITHRSVSPVQLFRHSKVAVATGQRAELHLKLAADLGVIKCTGVCSMRGSSSFVPRFQRKVCEAKQHWICRGRLMRVTPEGYIYFVFQSLLSTSDLLP